MRRWPSAGRRDSIVNVKQVGAVSAAGEQAVVHFFSATTEKGAARWAARLARRGFTPWLDFVVPGCGGHVVGVEFPPRDLTPGAVDAEIRALQELATRRRDITYAGLEICAPGARAPHIYRSPVRLVSDAFVGEGAPRGSTGALVDILDVGVFIFDSGDPTPDGYYPWFVVESGDFEVM
ncbi:hypothetical protein [Frondihabitans australicus]|uniref:Uncharacterized protein n=1 Tax=Frondihabitans australicus TaxID=386892 RepID=A0A495IE02_9MICO|nr:hypothetical protein [Frondihabitans australicus]RKR74233.1 hypothetical protein C8E83_1342 [Frondihabitans australicus]